MAAGAMAVVDPLWHAHVHEFNAIGLKWPLHLCCNLCVNEVSPTLSPDRDRIRLTLCPLEAEGQRC